jgi:L-ascorbate metabolism protein UlaG (beta-lactamase superfamily)
MRITYFGHSCFLIETQDLTRVILDPYEHGSYDGAVKYAAVNEPADIVLASHDHPDHSATDTIPGSPRIFVHPVGERVGSLTITGIQVAHDETGGTQRGKNTISVIDDGDLRLAHLGDLGHLLDQSTIKKIGAVDVLLIPVGGYFTIDYKAAAATVDTLAPSIVMPMHYKTPKIGFPIADAEAFLRTQNTVQRNLTATIEITKATLPAERTVIMLPYAR